MNIDPEHLQILVETGFQPPSATKRKFTGE